MVVIVRWFSKNNNYILKVFSVSKKPGMIPYPNCDGGEWEQQIIPLQVHGISTSLLTILVTVLLFMTSSQYDDPLP